MAKKQADTVDLSAELKKRVKMTEAVIIALKDYRKSCVNQDAHMFQYANGRIEQAEAELAYIKGLLDG